MNKLPLKGRRHHVKGVTTMLEAEAVDIEKLSLRAREILVELSVTPFNMERLRELLSSQDADDAARAAWHIFFWRINFNTETGRRIARALRLAYAEQGSKIDRREFDHALYQLIADGGDWHRRNVWTAFIAGWIQSLLGGAPVPDSWIDVILHWLEKKRIKAFLQPAN